MDNIPNKLYKYLPSRYVPQLLNQGNLLFRNLSYFRQYEDSIRGDMNEGIHIDHPDNPVRLQSLDGKIDISANFAFHNAITQDGIFVFCLSLRLGEDLFVEFQADECIEIFDVPRFLSQIRKALIKKPAINKYGLLARAVDYYQPNQAVNKSIKEPKNIPFFKHAHFSHQDEFRLVCGEKNAFKIRTTIIDVRIYDIREDVQKGVPHERILKIGEMLDYARIITPNK